ncbi:ferric iron uptake transcriptional regulator [Pseudoalteromonas tunicata]|jgi:Fur family ferric uptake transcriptional regulator|uniref:Ferric uptake regulation protein n=1 Tax=Pseudoalteromonas tunicata D2 TaxID=87626 RepID=A4CCB7_9GAMM|nr:ferric iron uptake transcriptional regulator [Pseudoalteromonas tunicata]ATC94552.1 Fur family transcriptional regulator, ferric uptake regulator [Pseudoalteromonas tunicata]AXT30279.1 ferric iron uptake transcriptional regulator [Pseudoalteromonas tunicata]EAR28004.1 ferric uptake regulator [Pseudoalteromonas tunicata D2]MDP4982162.1 ferric iron uptake transcriptional regulator [Pseudoalteromonas tunicata]MDP5212146.1 ferric iron uptake transcriptional regulator [Pseudoalteromonas tunicata
MSDHNLELKKAGLKVTLPRIKILEILQLPENQHISAEDVYKVLLEKGEEIGLATVYRVLNQFDDAGIVSRHHFEGGKSVFELSGITHHDHLVCLKCGKVVEFEDDLIESRQIEIASTNGIKLTNHSLYLYGECEDTAACKAFSDSNS